ncbi:hypothetical protein WJX84_001569 [Apatococcus fuscideae]|uniref:AP2/ERF domain-containing protein n=1 Tax=Apatococcus fuscideae TaxID=2026836 RepID=A0AAW1SZU9_9CHLO
MDALLDAAASMSTGCDTPSDRPELSGASGGGPAASGSTDEKVPVEEDRGSRSEQSTRFRGVYKNRHDGKWRAEITSGRRKKSLGLYVSEEEAAQAYDRAALSLRQAAHLICIAGDQHKLVGRYESAEAAARAYDQAAVALHGPEAFTNFTGTASPANVPVEVHQAALNGSPSNRMPRNALGKGSSKYRGVSWHKDNMKWRATIFKGSKPVHIGYFDSQETAARAYDQESLKLRGPNSNLNFPLSSYAALQLHDARLLEQNWQFLMALRASLACTPPALAQQVAWGPLAMVSWALRGPALHQPSMMSKPCMFLSGAATPHERSFQVGSEIGIIKLALG